MKFKAYLGMYCHDPKLSGFNASVPSHSAPIIMGKYVYSTG